MRKPSISKVKSLTKALMAEGKSYAQIAKALNEAGATTHSRGRQFTASTVGYMLRGLGKRQRRSPKKRNAIRSQPVRTQASRLTEVSKHRELRLTELLANILGTADISHERRVKISQLILEDTGGA